FVVLAAAKVWIPKKHGHVGVAVDEIDDIDRELSEPARGAILWKTAVVYIAIGEGGIIGRRQRPRDAYEPVEDLLSHLHLVAWTEEAPIEIDSAQLGGDSRRVDARKLFCNTPIS